MNNPYEELTEYINKELSYEDFCNILKEPVKTGSAKKNQLDILKNYIDLSTSYGKIKINKVYSENEILLIERKAKFSEYIEDLLIQYLANDSSHKVTMTYREMAEYFYMINKEYYKAKYDKHSYIDLFSLKTNQFYNKNELNCDIYKHMGIFFNISDKLIKEIIDGALKSLSNKSLIIARENFKLYRKEYSEETKEYYMQEFTCNKQQREEFLNIRKQLMNKYNIKKLQDIIYLDSDTRNNYFDELAQRMGESDTLNHCSRYANAYDIEYGDKAIEHEYKRIMSQNKKLINANMEYKLLTTKELECINQLLKEQFIDKFI